MFTAGWYKLHRPNPNGYRVFIYNEDNREIDNRFVRTLEQKDNFLKEYGIEQ